MKTIVALFFALIIARPVAGASADRPSARAKVGEVVDTIINNKPGPAGGGTEKTFTLAEDEINEYLEKRIQEEAGKGINEDISIKSASVRLKAGHIVEADAVAGFSAQFLGSPETGGEDGIIGTLRKYLSGETSFHLEGLVSSAKGKMFVKVLKVKIKGIPLPESLVRQGLGFLGEKQRPPIDLSKPFALPCGIQKVDILPQKLKIRIMLS